MTLIRYQRPYSVTPRTTFFNRWPNFDEEINRVFGTAFSSLLQGAEADSVWTHPRTDLFEDKEHFFLRAELPGLKKDDIRVELGEGVLTVAGTRRTPGGDGEKDRTSEFSRSVSVPSQVQEGAIAAKYEDGVLTVTLPKAEEVKPKRIAIEVK